MQKVHVHHAVGMVLCHDITQIIPGEFKGRAFKKGHVIKEQDIPKLLELGKEHIYVWSPDSDMVHENEAAQRIARAAAREGIVFTEPNQGRVSLIAEYDGLLQVQTRVLEEVNVIEQVVLATLHNHYLVKKGQIVAGTRVIPLVIEENKISKVENICSSQDGIIRVKPFRKVEVGMVTTGNEVYYGRIKDGFGPAVKKKIQEYNSHVIDQIFVPDSPEAIVAAINELVARGVDIIVVTGGMSVDPDDVTPLGIRLAGAEVVSYGAPVLPGSMTLLAYLGEIPILGLPGCVMYCKNTVFDLLLPRILAGEKITREEMTRMGHGGLCLECQTCSFPACPFGKGC